MNNMPHAQFTYSKFMSSISCYYRLFNTFSRIQIGTLIIKQESDDEYVSPVKHNSNITGTRLSPTLTILANTHSIVLCDSYKHS